MRNQEKKISDLLIGRKQSISKVLVGKLKDKDKDSYPDIMDCNPNNPSEHGIFSSIRSVVSGVVSGVKSTISKPTGAINGGGTGVSAPAPGGPSIYQGPVRPGVDVEVFRETGVSLPAPTPSEGFSRRNPITGEPEYVLPSGAVVPATKETTEAIRRGASEGEIMMKGVSKPIITPISRPTAILTKEQKIALVKRGELKLEAERRGRPFTRLEAERFMGGPKGISTLREATRKGYTYPRIEREKLLKIKKEEKEDIGIREKITEELFKIQQKIEESKIKEYEKKLTKLERERDIQKIEDFEIAPISIKRDLKTIKSFGRKLQIIGISGITAIPQFLLSTSRLLISPEREIPELVKYVSSGDAVKDITLKATEEPEAFVGELIALYGTAKLLPKTKIPKRGLKELEKAKPSISVGISKVTGDSAELLVKTGRQTKNLKAETTIKYNIEKVGEGFQVTKGKGSQKIIKKKTDKTLYGKEFTFTGEGGRVNIRKIKPSGEILKELGITEISKEIPKRLSPTFGRIEILPKGVPKPKLIKEPFYGVSRPFGEGWNLLVGGRVKKAIFRERRTPEGLVIRTTPKARVKPEAETISFIKRTIVDKELKPFGIKRTLPKERRTPFSKTFELELIKKQPPKPRLVKQPKLKALEKAKIIKDDLIGTPRMVGGKGLTKEQLARVKSGAIKLEGEAQIFGQAVERGAFKIKPTTTIEILPLKTEFKSRLDQERFVLGQDISQVSLRESDSPLFDTRLDITTTQEARRKQIQIPIQPIQLITPIVTETSKIPVPITPIPIQKPSKPRTLFFEGERPEFKKAKGYDVEVLRKSTDPRKRRWERLNKQLLTKDSALSMGARESDRDISARFRTKAREVVEKQEKGPKGKKGKVVKKAKVFVKVLDTKDKYYQDNIVKFRDYRVQKGKKIPLAIEKIERAKYRLDSPSEKRQIRQSQGLFFGFKR